MLNNRLVLIIGLLVPIIVIGGITLYNVLSNDNVVDTPPDVTDTPTNDTDAVIPDVTTDSSTENTESTDETDPPKTDTTEESENLEPPIDEDNIHLDVTGDVIPPKDPNPSASADDIIYGTKGENE